MKAIRIMASCSPPGHRPSSTLGEHFHHHPAASAQLGHRWAFSALSQFLWAVGRAHDPDVCQWIAEDMHYDSLPEKAGPNKML